MKIIGVIKENKYKANSTTVAKVERLDQVGSVLVRGNLSLLSANIPYEFDGEIVIEPGAEPIFSIKAATKTFALSQRESINYFKSSVFDEIGEKTATIIVDYFHDFVIEKILKNPDDLNNVPGIVDEKIQTIKETLRKVYNKDLIKEKFEQANLKIEFYNLLLKDTISNEQLQQILETDFYHYAYQKKLTPFEEVDRVAEAFSTAPNFLDQKIYWWAFKICNEILFSTGNSWLTLRELRQGLHAKFSNLTDEQMDLSIRTINKEKELLIFDAGVKDNVKKIYTVESYEDELTIAKSLQKIEGKQLKTIEFEFEEVISQVETYIAEILNIQNFKYNDEQKEAIYNFINSNVSVITGGPGTGKTTVILGLIKLYKLIYTKDSFAIMAPTGRAASRIKVDEEIFATTIHRFLKARGNNEFEYNKKNPTHKKLLIIDECSMIDNHLFASLLEGVIDVEKIVLVGDKNQLPSVGYGNLYEDIIDSQCFSTTELVQNNRQISNGEKNSIIDLANAIRENQIETFDFKNLTNVEFILDVNSAEALQKIKSIYRATNPISIDEQITDIQVIAPMYKNQLGVSNLNSTIQNLVNPDKTTEYKRGFMVFHNNDKVMFTENNATLELYNGDVGYIKRLNLLKTRLIDAQVNFSGLDKRLVPKQFANISLSYACTIHKTQGSEYATVILVLDDENAASRWFINKKMIYTAITRAKQKLVVVSSKQLFVNSCAKEMKKRNTTLTAKIIESFEK